jgi:hypothetical protein
MKKTTPENILDLLAIRDMDYDDIMRNISTCKSNVKACIATLIRNGKVFKYPKDGRHNARNVFTCDPLKARGTRCEVVKRNDIIPGARVFLADDPKRVEINRAIMLSQRKKSSVKVNIGTCWGMIMEASA